MLRRRKRKSIAARILFATVILIIIGLIGAVFLLNRYFPLRYADIISEHAEMHDLEPSFVFAVIHAESGFNSSAVSRAGASGLMQIIESTAYWLAPQIPIEDFNYETQIFDPATNVHIGTFYLSMLKNRFGSAEVALAAYNAGSGNVSSWLDNPEYSGDGQTLDYIPFTETRNYVERVASNQQKYDIILRFEWLFSRLP
jgi:soluble lytic murein transglycosylase